MKFFAFLLFLVNFQTVANSQKIEKGSSPAKPWSEIIGSFTCVKPPDTTEIIKSVLASTRPFKLNYSFGKWRIGYTYPHYYTITSFNQDKEELKLLPTLLGYPGEIKTLANYRVNISVSGTDPFKNNFSGNIIYNDSLFESYDDIFFAKRKNYYKYNFRKSAVATLITSKNDTASIFIALNFGKKGSTTDNGSYIRVRNSIINVKPTFSKSPEESPYTNGFSGFEFLYNNIPIGAVFLGKDFFGGMEYKFWLNNDQDDHIKQSVAMALFIIVKLF